MLRKLALITVFAPYVLSAQGIIKGPDAARPDVAKEQARKARVLDVAASTPFFTKKGAESVKKVIAGGDARKADESVHEPLDAKPTPMLAGGQPGQLPGTSQGKGQQAPMPTVPQAQPDAAKFAWRLLGISYGKCRGLALFEVDGKAKSVGSGSVLDSDTKILSISKTLVVLEFRGKRIELYPW